jgi:polysaccharide export outer membrane protein
MSKPNLSRIRITGALVIALLFLQGLGTAQSLSAVPARISAASTNLSKPDPHSNVPEAASASTAAADSDYRIGAGDVLNISVWKEPEVSVPSIIVRPDGKITVPLVKDIEVAGCTPAEAEKAITKALSPYITDVNVTVIVTGINSKRIYVIGAVKKEGPLAYTHRMTVLQALTEAGGLTDYAKRKKIYVLRAQNGKETRIPFNYDEVLKGKDREHIWLLPDDTLVVPH